MNRCVQGYTGSMCETEITVTADSKKILIITLSVVGGILVILGVMVATMLWKNRRSG